MDELCAIAAAAYQKYVSRIGRTPAPMTADYAQNYHVRHRLDRYHAGRYMDYQTAGPADIAAAIAAAIGRPVDYRPVTTDGDARAASLLASLL